MLHRSVLVKREYSFYNIQSRLDQENVTRRFIGSWSCRKERLKSTYNVKYYKAKGSHLLMPVDPINV